MSQFVRILRTNSSIAMAIGGAFLLGTMTIIMTSVVSRRFGHPVYGVYEWVELLMVPVVAAALGYAELKKGHVAVSIVAEKLGRRMRGFVDSFNAFVSLAVWAVVLWATMRIGVERAFEQSLIHKFSLLPFRVVFAYGLLCWCLVLLADFIEGIRKGAGK